MNLTRRQMLCASVGAAAAGVFGFSLSASATPEATAESIKNFAGGKEPAMGGDLTLNTPEIAENGNTVPVEVSVASPMTDDDYVESVVIYAEGNPNPDVAVFHFTPMSGVAEAKTRMRLAKTQNVVAVAKTNKGQVFMDKKEVKVTIGGCGG
ncbi:thiosulfate oxidation carrier protein SoxY [Thalassospira sp.]|uniref:thiosulfate oxidation carrier protein SoxY n=1 Tax=Thalassospira sp. TaxID=1912094 RepID=UPI000C627170|nr:thiosulfate oxidation carrier protein SoxY [Thalassospira sp.]MBC05630.1 thiosulfate oxidation carrier protein SoxY [Thalassospira sp.]